MPLTANGTANWQRAYTGANTGAGGACSLVDAGNYSGAIGTIKQNAAWRVDRQNPPIGMINLQIQKNGVGNPSTIACCLVPANLSNQVGNPTLAGPLQERARARFSELTRAIHSGLTQSVGSRRARVGHPGEMEVQIFQVQGNFSA